MVALKAHFDGNVIVPDEPVDLRPGDPLLVHVHTLPAGSPIPLTAGELARSGIIGLWRDREDIPDSAAYARQLKEQAQRRQNTP